MQQESRKGKEDYIWLHEGQSHVGDHTIEDDKRVFWNTYELVREEGFHSK